MHCDNQLIHLQINQLPNYQNDRDGLFQPPVGLFEHNLLVFKSCMTGCFGPEAFKSKVCYWKV